MSWHFKNKVTVPEILDPKGRERFAYTVSQVRNLDAQTIIYQAGPIIVASRRRDRYHVTSYNNIWITLIEIIQAKYAELY